MYEKALGYTEFIHRSGSIDTAWAGLNEQLSGYGFRLAKYGFVAFVDPVSPTVSPSWLGGFDQEWEETYQREGMANHDHLVKHCIASTDPITFRHLYDLMDEGHLTPEASRCHEFGRATGYRNGVAIPLRDMTPLSRGGISLVADGSVSDREFDGLLTRYGREIEALAQIFHAGIRRSELLEPRQHLSPRERECLKWAVYGLISKQIAHRMQIHPKTVEKHLASARRRLGAKTNIQAVAIALAYGMIDP